MSMDYLMDWQTETMELRKHMAGYMQALALASLKTWNPKERAGRKRVLLATCSSGFSSGREVLSTSCSR